MKLTKLQKYKHDTLGKFQTLKELIEELNESSLETSETREILDAADEIYEKMSQSSKDLINSLSQ